MQNTTKPIWQSKTFWINVLSLVVYILAYPQLNHFVSPQISGSVMAIANIGLRYVTNTGVTLI